MRPQTMPGNVLVDNVKYQHIVETTPLFDLAMYAADIVALNYLTRAPRDQLIFFHVVKDFIRAFCK